VKKLAAEHGRNPEQVKILPGVFFILGDTEAAARERLRELDELIVEAPALKLLNLRLGTSFGEQDLDRPLPTLPPTETHGGHQGRYQIILEMARRENLTIRQTMRRYVSGRGHHVVVGTPEQLADDLASWVTQSAADGFTLLPPTLPESLDLFVSQVVPLLKARGAMPEEYEGTTLRDHYCLGSPQR
jgi:alkanesulfonate monooxygenase SsuD/methylene tetrahydromethanopterin reductase-like flavin-dependent oxidoreductase (luciferase family)